MPRLLTAALAALCALAIIAPASPAALSKCPTTSMYELTKVDGVSCKRAKKVLKQWFNDNSATPFGFTCRQKFYEGGVTTKCRKGDKRIVHASAD